ncbi:DUF4397 domain-containing protein [Aestuariibacter halophilus]|uniref:DUF4397 domain-containing protein n=1 Tax=Fluctibacter halophilus TaxID=226011 RepID=A0ABS8G9S5_9ALTE|nr:DUF4397 domain-containing protein [Aestuariibacter halophilus]MCC2617258.1 DUF4397 domain-containing protein [Aestuariibacter halophilus]
MRSNLRYPLAAVALSLGLAGCGGSDDNNSEFPDGYLQFYNGSANSAVTTMSGVEQGTLGSAAFGDATSMFSLDAGDVDIEFYRTDSDDQQVLVDEMTVNLSEGDKTLVMLTGDYSNPVFSEYTFEREDMVDHFRLFATSTIETNGSYDVYMSDSGAPFESANLLGTVTYQGFDEFAYWDGDEDSDDFDEGEYTIYLTAPGGSEVLFESPTINFGFATEYVLAIRESTGAIQDAVQIDLITNSSSVTTYADTDATAQYRIYNSLDGDATLTVSLDGNDTEGQEIALDANTLSDFTDIEFGDYRLSAQNADASLSFNNRLVTLNQGQSKAIVLYMDAEQKLSSLSFAESNLPQVYDKEVRAVNLVPDFVDVDLYFVRKDETIESAQFVLSSIDFGESKELSLPSDFYELIAVYDGNEDTQQLLDRTQLLGLNEEQNYIITIEPSTDSPTGYAISLLY